jgi:hypothetical protein
MSERGSTPRHALIRSHQHRGTAGFSRAKLSTGSNLERLGRLAGAGDWGMRFEAYPA